MSVVIIGGNERMERTYKELCQSYGCCAKVFTKTRGGLRNKIGNPDLLVLFTSTMSHQMLHGALNETRGQNTIVARAHSSSASALRSILEAHTG